MRKSRFIYIAVTGILLFPLLLTGCARNATSSTAPDPSIPPTTMTVTAPTPLTASSTPTSPYTTVTSPDGLFSMELTSPQDGSTTHVNVQRVAGIVSNPAALVKVNDVQAWVAPDGSFVAFIELPVGTDNLNVVASSGADTVSQEMSVTFTPPLAIFLDYFQPSPGVNYLVTPAILTGYVNYPEASVTVGENPAVVSPDGSFTAQVMLNAWGSGGGVLQGTSAVATLGDQTDSDGWGIGVSENGNVIYSPGNGINRMMTSYFEESTITLKAGESTLIYGTIQTFKSIDAPTPVELQVNYPVSNSIVVQLQPLPSPYTLPQFTGSQPLLKLRRPDHRVNTG